ncbi:lysophospholipid acyltransferase family protein [Nocardioides marmoribigeumensis]|uniref:1-acyl-sn-glycerol-3-phosphate acyltransferase n=1 Tax=Nocardioides marmoribigeumensis TaxID=433649 RepID=A0ABU2BSW2_9ACTN|nr:lysophospholipid acyltransferase family protein [Nocardioides marmoribigeumensis]MDR7361722.1 1-acyl-sn-glycerol-3-phosphate acyltransferase [Nocardioides marmoribigeumensis]
MPDAEIIPLGTRGRPGRGTGRDKPSSSSRDLWSPRKDTDPPRQDGEGTDPVEETRPTEPVEQAEATEPEPTEPTEPTEPETAEAPGLLREPRVGEPVTGEAGDAAIHTLQPLGGRADAGVVPGVVLGNDRPGTKVGPLGLGELLPVLRGAAERVFGEDADRRLAEMLAFLRRRVTGDYTVDEYGLDSEFVDRFVMEALRPLATKWFRIEVRGAENIPRDSGALVVANHSGTVPVDGIMTMFAVHETTGRHLRPLGADLVFRLPFVSEVARKAGATLACNEDAHRMLSNGELAAVWPEGFKGIGKPYSERYKLQRFGRGGFVSAAIRTGVPIVPCSIVGAEEIYPLVGNIPSLARLLGVPYIPITPFFPLLGPLGLVPLPSKWIIEFGEPVRTDSYDPGAADDPMLVFNVTDQVRETIQQTLYALLMRRKSVFH